MILIFPIYHKPVLSAPLLTQEIPRREKWGDGFTTMERLQNILVEVLRNSSIAEFAFCSPRSKPSDLWRIGAVLRSVRVETLEHCQSLQQHWHLVQNWISEEYWKLCETSHLSPLHSPPLLQNNICDRKALFRASVSCCTQISQLHFRWSPRTLWQRVPNRVIEFENSPAMDLLKFEGENLSFWNLRFEHGLDDRRGRQICV